MMRMLTLAAMAMCACSLAFAQTSGEQNQSMTGQSTTSHQSMGSGMSGYGTGDRWWMDTGSYNNWDSMQRVNWLTHDLSAGDQYHLMKMMNDLPAGDSFVVMKALDSISNHRYMMWTGNSSATMTSSDTSMNRMNRRRGRRHDKDMDQASATATTSTPGSGVATDSSSGMSSEMPTRSYGMMSNSGAMWQNDMSGMKVNDWQAYSILVAGLNDSERGNFANCWSSLGWRDQGILLKLAKDYGDTSMANNGGWGY